MFAGKKVGQALSPANVHRSEEHTSELQSLRHLVCRLLLEKKILEKLSTHTSALAPRAASGFSFCVRTLPVTCVPVWFRSRYIGSFSPLSSTRFFSTHGPPKVFPFSPDTSFPQ